MAEKRIIEASASDLSGSHPVQKKIALAREENQELHAALMREVGRRVQLQLFLVIALSKLSDNGNLSVFKQDMEAATGHDVKVERCGEGENRWVQLSLIKREVQDVEAVSADQPGSGCGPEAGGGAEGS